MALAALALVAAGCGGSKDAAGGGATAPAQVTAGKPMLIFRSTISGDVIAEAADKSGQNKLDLGIDATAESLADMTCAPNGTAAAYAISGQDGTTRVKIAGEGSGAGVQVQVPLRVAGMAWSPDGSKIAITAFPSNGIGGYRLMMLNVATGAIEDELSGEGLIGPPRWSPDGTSLIFEIGNRAPSQVYMIRLGDAAPARITNRQQGAFAPEWAPDGKEIIYAGPGSDFVSQLYSYPVSGGTERPLTSSTVSKTLPRFSPDGSSLAFVGTLAVPVASVLPVSMHNLGVWVSSPDGAGEELFTDIRQDAWLLGWCVAGPWLDALAAR